MKYPIDVEEYIAAAQVEFGENATVEECYREIIPMVNLCYERGRKGAPGYPMDAAKENRDFKEATGESFIDVELFTGLIDWCNRAYAQGREDQA